MVIQDPTNNGTGGLKLLAVTVSHMGNASYCQGVVTVGISVIKMKYFINGVLQAWGLIPGP